MIEAEYLKFLQMKRQASTPFMPLINAAQLWMDSDNHLQGRLHKQGDPGLDVEYKLLDFVYATFFGKRETVTCAATVNLTAGAYNQIYCVVDQDMQLNISGGHEGQFLCFVLKQDGTGNHNITFNTGFASVDSRTAAANQYSVVFCIFDDDNDLWHEIKAASEPHAPVLKVYREDQSLATGDGAAYITIPIEFHGYKINTVGAHVYGPSTSGAITVMLHNKTQAVDILTTPITIDANELDSSTAATPAVIDTNNNTVSHADEIRIDIDAAGSGATGLEVRFGLSL